MQRSPLLEVQVPADDVVLDGDLVVPTPVRAVVVFAHGSGSSRFSHRNRAVAAGLQAHGLATLLLDLLTRDEEAVDDTSGQYRFDIPRLGRRVVAAVDWVARHDDLRGLPIGVFGASTGAAAALIGAAERPQHVGAVVSRGGRPDLAGAVLAMVQAPTLLIVGGHDETVLALNRDGARLLPDAEIAVVPGATHLFEEPGALDAVTTLAARWFTRHLVPAGDARDVAHPA